MGSSRCMGAMSGGLSLPKVHCCFSKGRSSHCRWPGLGSELQRLTFQFNHGVGYKTHMASASTRSISDTPGSAGLWGLGLFFFLFNFLSFIEVELVYKVAFTSAIEHSDSVIHTAILIQIPSPPRLSRNIVGGLTYWDLCPGTGFSLHSGAEGTLLRPTPGAIVKFESQVLMKISHGLFPMS